MELKKHVGLALRVCLALVMPFMIAAPLLIWAHRLGLASPASKGPAQLAAITLAALVGALIISTVTRGVRALLAAAAYFGLLWFVLVYFGLLIEGRFFGNSL